MMRNCTKSGAFRHAEKPKVFRAESEKPIWNEFEERLLDSDEPFELSDQEIWERIYGRNAKPFDWRKSNIEI